MAEGFFFHWQAVKNRWHRFVPASGPAGPRGPAPFIVLKKGNYNVNVSQQESEPKKTSSEVDGESSQRGLTAKRRLGSV